MGNFHRAQSRIAKGTRFMCAGYRIPWFNPYSKKYIILAPSGKAFITA